MKRAKPYAVVRFASVLIAPVLFFAGLGWFLTSGAPVTHAQSSTPMMIDRVRNNCTSIKSSLNTIHTNDTLMRVNIGQTYNTISGKLMARMNARLAVNRIAAPKLTEITSNFERDRAQFSDDFNRYDSAISAVLKINCAASPSEFYNQLIVARDARHRVSVSVTELNDGITEYKAELKKLSSAIERSRTQGGEGANQ